MDQADRKGVVVPMKPEKETLTIEFKSDQGPIQMSQLYDAIVAMANTDGGILYLGIEDNGQVTGVSNQHTNIVEMKAKIESHTTPMLTVKPSIITLEGKKVLSIEVPISHSLIMTSSGRYLRRRMKQDNTPEAVPMRPDEIMQRLSYVQAIDPSAQVIEDIPAEKALSPLERERLRELVRTYRGDVTLLSLTDEELDKALTFVKERNGVLYPTIAGLLMIGHERYIRDYVPSNEVLFQVLDGTDVLVNQSAMHGPLLQIFEKVEMMFQSRVTEQELQIGLFRVGIPNFEEIAFREGFINALVHRDYFRSGCVQVQLQLQDNSLYIASAGGFPEGVSVDNILTVAPTARNKVMADAAMRIGLAERTGRGVDKIYTAMLRDGHEIPDYSNSNSTCVRLDLKSAKLDEAYIRMLVEEEKKLEPKLMPVDALIALSTLRSERTLTVEYLAKRIQRSEAKAKETLEWLCELGMVEKLRRRGSSDYILSSKVYSLTNNKAGYTRQKGFSKIQESEMIIAHLENYGSIRRRDVAELCKCNNSRATYLLQGLVMSGKIVLIGKGKGAHYILKR